MEKFTFIVAMMVVVGMAELHTCDIDPNESANIFSFVVFELIQAIPQRVWVNDVAPDNIESCR